MKTTTTETTNCTASTFSLIPMCPQPTPFFPPQSVYRPRSCK